MEVRFWGTRGSVPSPGTSTARYGGNTSCIEVRSQSGTLVILDCGTGARELGRRLREGAQGPLRGHLLISHTHWDHIQGLPFFEPLFVPGNEWDIYGPQGLLQGLREALAGQMQHTYFPVSLEQLGATIRYHNLVEGTLAIGDIAVTTSYLNHTALALGYRLQADGVSLAYCCDHEPHALALVSGEGPLVGHDRRHAEFLSGADLVVHDAQYTAADFPEKAGWGHSSAEYAVRVCAEAGVARLALAHHDPLRVDEEIDRIVARLRRAASERGWRLEIMAAAEGQALELRSAGRAGPNRPSARFRAQTAIDTSARSRPVLVWLEDARKRALIEEALRQERLLVRVPADRDELVRLVAQLRPSLILVEHVPGRLDAIDVVRCVRAEEAAQPVKVPIAILADQDQATVPGSEEATDWVVWPITPSYARAMIRAWVLRAAIRWIRAKVPQDEKRRLQALHDLDILDTPHDKRLDRITRMASVAFEVPIALVSLVNGDRQWFKSCVGLDVAQTSRDVALSAHAVEQRADLIVPDALLDSRFADNPFVQDKPRVRFFAAAPLILGDGSCIGALCIADARPRELGDAERSLLHDLRDLVVEEIEARATRDSTLRG